MSLLTDFQIPCLLAIAREGGNKVFSVSFMKKVEYEVSIYNFIWEEVTIFGAG
jgi:hypothetical protein